MPIQLITPNPNIPYYGGLCEGFVEGTVGQATPPFKDKDGKYTTSGVYPTAMAAWAANRGNHSGELPPPGLRVALYFTLGSTPAGHTALALGDGRVASSTQPGYHSTGYIHPSLQHLVDLYAKHNNGCTYLGWTEYIGKLKVIDMGGNMSTQEATDDEIDEAHQVGFRNRRASKEQKDMWRGKPLGGWVQAIHNSPTFQQQLAYFDNLEAKAGELQGQVTSLKKQLESIPQDTSEAEKTLAELSEALRKVIK